MKIHAIWCHYFLYVDVSMTILTMCVTSLERKEVHGFVRRLQKRAITLRWNPITTGRVVELNRPTHGLLLYAIQDFTKYSDAMIKMVKSYYARLI
ncbi:hypothetical protein Ancab_039547 [Ancistrocladus abbreviatus]